MPIADGPFGSYFGMFADKFGVQWMVDFTVRCSTFVG
jgi:PhnB protein